jgi:hypothetical protein
VSRARGLVGAALLTLATAIAHADEPPRSSLSLAVASGASLPAPSTSLGIGLSLGVDAAWRPRAAGGWLSVGLGVEGTQRTAHGSGRDGELDFAWRTVARELWIAPDVQLRLPLAPGLTLGVGGGPALVLVGTVNGGTLLGDAFADGRESSTVLGVCAGVSGEWHVATGALVLDLGYRRARISQVATGAGAHLDAVALRVGYRFWF